DAFFTAAPAGLAILDRELRYVQLNETLAAMNGLSVQEHLGSPVREVLPALAPVVEPILQQILATGEPALNIEVSGESLAQTGATRHWLASYFPLPGRGGRPAGIGAIVVEDTGRRRAEEARRRSGAEFRAIVEQATYGIYRSTVDGKLKRVNPALVRMLGYDSEAEVLALDLARDVYVEPAERDRLIEQYRAAQVIKGVEAAWKRKDGHHILVRLSGRPLRDEKKQLIGFSMLAEDVTEQRTLERALQQAQKMETVGQLTGGIAHDFNNLLTVILAHARLLAEALPADRPDLRRDLEEVQGATRRGAELVRKLLGFSRHEKLELQALDLADWTRDVLAVLRRVLPSNIEIQFEPAGDRGLVKADPVALEQVLMNLVNNARDAMPDGGTLHVEVGPVTLAEEDRPLHAWIEPGPFVCLTVSDTGVGMDEPTLARVFQPFFTTKPPGVGTGLGLPMVYGLVKQHKGFVHFYSEVGQGTTAKVYLPVAPDQARAVRAPTRDELLPGGSESVLLIEDEARLRNVAERLLRKVGYRVLAAPDGEQGLALYRAHRNEFDLIVTDLMMPRLGGMRLYEMLRLDGEPIKVLFTSGYPEQQFRERASRDPAVAFVTKPWTASELLKQVRGLLDRTVPRAEPPRCRG
ncbi:MAG: PAS domain-containing protein, partial [Gemmatimonadales bacterium]|nr:PAS domain-containing protein [Gemmatimonadales bacterium]